MKKEQLDTIRARVEWLEKYNVHRMAELAEMGLPIDEARALLDEVERLNLLSTLLARIFRDGGHREAQSGIEQSVDVADKLVAELHRAVDEGFARGAEAMRKAVRAEFERWIIAKESGFSFVRSLRTLPVSEDKA
jgi:hypothetical protein